MCGIGGFVDFDRHHMSRPLREVLGHGSDTRSHLHNTVIFGNLCRVHDFFQHMGIDQEVLAELFLKIKVIFLQYLNGIGRNSKCCHFSSLFSVRLF